MEIYHVCTFFYCSISFFLFENVKSMGFGERYLREHLLNADDIEFLNAFVNRNSKLHKAEILGRKVRNGDRKSDVTWLDLSSKSKPGNLIIPAHISNKIRAFAKRSFATFGTEMCPIGCNKKGSWIPRYEALQYSIYPPGAHYSGWHTDGDVDAENDNFRCLSLVTLLSDPSEFTGGEFKISVNSKEKNNKI